MTAIARFPKRFILTIPFAQRVEYGLIGLWLLAMIALPIALWLLGDGVYSAGINIAAVLQAGAVFAILQRQWGLRRALMTFAIVAGMTWAAEYIGSHTGFPFGTYTYTATLQPQLAGIPVLVPVAWFMLLPSAWAMAQLIVGDYRASRAKQAAFVLVSAAALTAWDLFLDPQMVARDFWRWSQPSGYFGIPFSNYAGWLLTACLVTLLARPAKLDAAPLVLIYGCVWFLQSIGQAVFWGQPGPALCGSLAMGTVMLAAYLRQSRRGAA